MFYFVPHMIALKVKRFILYGLCTIH